MVLNYSKEESQEGICFEESSKPTETASLETDVVENWTEEYVDDRATGNTDTVMQPIDFREFNEVLNVAPDLENITVRYVFKDINSEFLAFPTTYCGKARPDNKE